MQLKQNTLYIGNEITLDLEFTNQLTKQPHWSKDNIPLKNNDRIFIESIRNRVTLS